MYPLHCCCCNFSVFFFLYLFSLHLVGWYCERFIFFIGLFFYTSLSLLHTTFDFFSSIWLSIDCWYLFYTQYNNELYIPYKFEHFWNIFLLQSDTYLSIIQCCYSISLYAMYCTKSDELNLFYFSFILSRFECCFSCILAIVHLKIDNR